MKRVATLAAIAVAGSALTLSTATASTSTATSTGQADRSHPPAVKGATKWTKISTGNVSLINEPALYRTSNGVLHVAYGRGSGSTPTSLDWSNVSKHGPLLGQGTLLSGWDSYSTEPKLIAGPGNGIRIVFDGISIDGPAPYDDSRLYTATADPAGTDWALAPGAMTFESTGTYGIGAVSIPNAAPIVAFPLNDDIYWRQADGSTTPTSADNHVTNGDCCAYHTELARDAKDGRVFLGWHGNGGANNTRGIFVKRLLPSAGPKVKAPGSSRLDPEQTVAMTGRRDAPGVYAAYCVGYPTCKAVKLWRVGASRAITVSRSKGADTIAIAPAPSGRLWVAWENDDTNRVYATLTNRKATRFGAVRAVRTPQRDTFRLSAYSGAVRHLDVVVNTEGELFHRQLLPGLKLTAKPQRFDNDGRQVVTFRVTDAGTPVDHARIRVAGKTKVTGAKGQVRIPFRAGTKPGRYHATAAKAGYVKGHVTIRVLR